MPIISFHQHLSLFLSRITYQRLKNTLETNGNIDERALLLRLREGDQAAFEQVYHRHKARIFRNIRKLVRSEAIAAELHQDIFLKFWLYRERIDADQPIEAYLVTIAKNVAIDFYKKAAKEKALQDQLMATMTVYHDELTAQVDFKDTRAILEAVIAQLPPQRQQVYRLVKLEQKTYEEAAAHFSVSVGTIKDHMAKAAKFIQAEFSKKNITLFIVALSAAVVAS